MPNQAVHARKRTALAVVLALILAAFMPWAAPSAQAQDAPAPWITSDKDDYPPGGLVSLAGGGWQPGESVRILVDDDEGRTWQRDVTVDADAGGAIVDVFNLPDWFVATYSVVATGAVSGVARTSFTDGNVDFVTTSAPIPNVAWSTYSSANCTGSPRTGGGNGGVDTMGNTSATALRVGINANQSARLTVPATVGGLQFSSWSGTPIVTLPSSTTICVPGNGGGELNVYQANYGPAIAATALSVSPSTGTYGGTASVSATLTTNSTPVVGKTVSFSLNGTSGGSATTDASGVASLSGASLAGINAGTYPTGISASFAGDSSHAASNGSAALSVAPASQAIAFASLADRTFGDPAFSVAATGGASGQPVTFAASGECTVTGAEVTLTGAGQCTVTASQSGTANYSAAADVARTFAIGKATGTLSLTDLVHVYDGSAKSATAVTTPSGLSGTAITYTLDGTPVPSPTRAGTYEATVTLDDPDYAAAPFNAQLVIQPKPITGSFTAQDKTYDGTTAASVSNRSLDGVLSGDAVSMTGGTPTFDTRNVGTGKAVTLSGATLSGADASNYSLTSVSTSSADISPLSVAGSFSVDTRPYDGTTAATVADRSLVGIVAGDGVALVDGSATFDTETAGTGKTVTGTGFALAGDDAANYSLASSTLTTLADITPKPISGSFTADDKVYNGTTAASVSEVLLDGLVTGDTVIGSVSDATFSDKNVGTEKTVSGTLVLDGADAANYVATPSEIETNADITALGITGSFTAADKVYDGSTSAAVLDRALSGVLGSDDVSLEGGTAAFADKNAGADKVVTLTGASLDGEDAGNYDLTNIAGATATITALGITGAFTAADKVYDGTTEAVVLSRSLVGAVSGDAVSLDGGTAAFADKHVGTGKAVTLTGAGLAGADAGNYTLGSVATATASIAAKGLTASFAAADKDYDGTDVAQVSGQSLDGVATDDEVILSVTNARFDSKDVGVDRTVTADFALSGAQASNYTVSATGTTQASINPRVLTGSFAVAGKVYDGSTDATIVEGSRGLQNVVDGDVVTLEGGTASFAGTNAGIWSVIGSGFTLGGGDAGNYALGTVSAPAAQITPLEITGTFTAQDKVYDGTTAATIATRSVNGKVAGDDVVLTGGTATFDTMNVGTDRMVTGSGFSLTGSAAANYTLASSTLETEADITPLGVTGSFTASSKPYDGTTNAAVSDPTLATPVSGDDVDLSVGNAQFDNQNVGTAKLVTGELSLTGTDAGNYTLLSDTATTTADITPLGLTGSFTAADKVYDGNISATISGQSLTGVLGSDAVTLEGGTATFDTKDVGAGKTVTGTGFTLAGSDAGNYTLASVATTTADITPLGLTGSFTAADKVYDGNISATISGRSLTGVLGSDVVTLEGGTATFDTKDVGAGKTVTGTGFTLAGSDAGNYTLASSTLTTAASITPRGVTVTPTPSTVTVVLGSAVPEFAPGYNGFIPGEGPDVLDQAATCSTAYTPSSGVGSYPVTCVGAAAQNYTFEYVNGAVRVEFGWDGFLQPINNTAHQVGTQSKFKLGQTIPAKFVLRNAAGHVVTQPTAPGFTAVLINTSCSQSVPSEVQDAVAPSSSPTFSWNGNHYQYNWSTKGLKSGVYRIGATLTSGQLAYTDICLEK